MIEISKFSITMIKNRVARIKNAQVRGSCLALKLLVSNCPRSS
jgi:hypothetical protein